MAKKLTISLLTLALAVSTAGACTSAIVSASVSRSGKPLLWKHRDTSSHESNFIERVEADNGKLGYVALFNAGDSLLAEAWIGVNDADFAIMNTASYNLAPDTAIYRDREGFIMTEALATCTSVEDFGELLDRLPKPLGVSANFGVIDSHGNGAFFETDDYGYVVFNLSDAPDGILIRTNYSFSGDENGGYGYIRYKNAEQQISKYLETEKLAPWDFTEGISRSFYHSIYNRDMASDSTRWVADNDFVARYSSTASVVIEGSLPGDTTGRRSVMWGALGYPPCAIVERISAGHVPDNVRPVLSGFKSEASQTAIAKKHKAFPMKDCNGSRYIDMYYLRPEIESCRIQSINKYGL